MKKQTLASKIGLYIAYRDLDHRWSKIGVTGDSFERRFAIKNQGEPQYYRVKKYTLFRLPRKDALAIEKHVVENFVTHRREDKEWVRFPAKELFTVVAGVINNHFPQHIPALDKARKELSEDAEASQNQKKRAAKKGTKKSKPGTGARTKGSKLRKILPPKQKTDPVALARLVKKLKDTVEELGPGITPHRTEVYEGYKKGSEIFITFAPVPKKERIRVWLKLDPSREKTDGVVVRDMSNTNRIGLGKLELVVDSETTLFEHQHLLHKAYANA